VHIKVNVPASLIAPYLAQDLLTRKNSSWVPYEIAQEPKLPSREISRFAFSRNLSAADIHMD
jgi:hypothetical protein